MENKIFRGVIAFVNRFTRKDEIFGSMTKGNSIVDTSVSVKVNEETQSNLTRAGASAQEVYEAALATAIINRVSVRIDNMDDVTNNGPTQLPM